MAVAFGAIEGEPECGPTGATDAASSHVLVTEWCASEHFPEVSGYIFTLSHAIDAAAIKIEAMTELTDDHMFAGVFGMEALIRSDFNAALGFEKCVQMIVFALKGEKGITAAVKHVSVDAVDVVIRAPVACFEATYKLRLFRAQMDKTHVLSARLKEAWAECEATKLQLAAARNQIDEMKTKMDSERHSAEERLTKATIQIDALKAKIEEEIAVRHAAEDRLTKAMSQIDELKTKFTASTTESETLTTSLMGEIRKRDSRIVDLEKMRLLGAAAERAIYSKFRFDNALESFCTRPKRFELSADGKSVTAKEGYAQILLTPAITSDSEVTFVVEETGTEYFAVGVTDDCTKWLSKGCYFSSNGFVKVKSSNVAKSQSFGGWKQGDHLCLDLDLTRGTVSIHAPNGQYTAKWTPKSAWTFGSSEVWFGVYSHGTGTKIAIE